MQLTSAPTVLLEAAAASATATASASPIGMLLMILILLVVPGLIVMFVLLGKKKRAAALKPVTKPQATAPKAAPSSASENIDAIEKLAKLHQQGILTDEEFQQKKKMMLDKI